MDRPRQGRAITVTRCNPRIVFVALAGFALLFLSFNLSLLVGNSDLSMPDVPWLPPGPLNASLASTLDHVYGWDVSAANLTGNGLVDVHTVPTECPQLVVLGMHHSGTSIITRLLMDVGFWAGRPPPVNDHNGQSTDLSVLHGKYAWKFWELHELVSTNQKVFEQAVSFSVRSHAPSIPNSAATAWTGMLYNSDMVDAASRREFAVSAAKIVAELLEAPMRRIRGATASARRPIGWVMKDPRLSLTLELWKRFLPRLGCIVMVRDPIEVAASLAKSYGMTGRAATGLSVHHFLWLWEYYMRTMLSSCRDTPTLFVDHGGLIDGVSHDKLALSFGAQPSRGSFLSNLSQTVRNAFVAPHDDPRSNSSITPSAGLRALFQHFRSRDVVHQRQSKGKDTEEPLAPVFVERLVHALRTYPYVFRGSIHRELNATIATEAASKILSVTFGHKSTESGAPNDGDELRSSDINFFLIWTTEPESFTSLNRRCIESIFFHHPSAAVMVYSPTLPETFFTAFSSRGYNIKVVHFEPNTVARAALPNFPDFAAAASVGPFYFSHFTDVLRVHLLHTFGGIYLDTDVVVVNPLNGLPSACLGRQYRPSEAVLRPAAPINGAVMVFRKPGHPFLKAVLSSISPSTYDLRSWAGVGPALLTSILTQDTQMDWGVTILPVQRFYPLDWRRVQPCLAALDGCLPAWDYVKRFSYTLHLYTHQLLSACHAVSGCDIEHDIDATSSSRRNIILKALDEFRVLAHTSSMPQFGLDSVGDFFRRSVNNDFFTSQDKVIRGTCETALDDSVTTNSTEHSLKPLHMLNWCCSAGPPARSRFSIAREVGLGHKQVLVEVEHLENSRNEEITLSGDGHVLLETVLDCSDCETRLSMCMERTNQGRIGVNGSLGVEIRLTLIVQEEDGEKPSFRKGSPVIRYCVADSASSLRDLNPNCDRFEVIPSWGIGTAEQDADGCRNTSDSLSWANIRLPFQHLFQTAAGSPKVTKVAVQFILPIQGSRMLMHGNVRRVERLLASSATSVNIEQAQWVDGTGWRVERPDGACGHISRTGCIHLRDRHQSMHARFQCPMTKLELSFYTTLTQQYQRPGQPKHVKVPFAIVIKDTVTGAAVKLCFNFKLWHRDCFSVEIVAFETWVSRSVDISNIFSGQVSDPEVHLSIGDQSTDDQEVDMLLKGASLFVTGKIFGEPARACEVMDEPSCAATSTSLLPLRFDDHGLSPTKKDRAFYLYTGADFNFDDTLTCYARMNGGKSILTHEKRDTAQNTADIRLHNALLNHPLRTTDASKASLFVVDVFSIASWTVDAQSTQSYRTHRAATKGNRQASPVCAGMSHTERISIVEKELSQSVWFRRHGGRDHLLICQSHNCKNSLGSRLPQLLRHGYLAINERNGRWANWKCEDHIIVIPYVCNTEIPKMMVYLWDIGDRSMGDLRGTFQPENPLQKCWRTQSRSQPWWEVIVQCKTVRVVFIGSVRNVEFDQDTNLPVGKNLDALRLKLLRLKGLWARSGEESSRDIYIELLEDADEFREQEQATHYAEWMLRSEMCLVPAGDTPSSRRLFDAIMAMCVPIIIADGLNNSLPFSWRFDYSEFAFFISEAQFSANPASVIDALYASATDMRQGASDLQRKQQRLAQVVHELTFNPEFTTLFPRSELHSNPYFREAAKRWADTVGPSKVADNMLAEAWYRMNGAATPRSPPPST